MNVLYALYAPEYDKYVFLEGSVEPPWETSILAVSWSSQIKTVWDELRGIDDEIFNSNNNLLDLKQYREDEKKKYYSKTTVANWVIVKVYCDAITEEYEADFTESYIVGEIL